jgi:hypothetical protein
MVLQRRQTISAAAHRLAQRLHQEAIPYALMGAAAVSAHGARPVKDDVIVLLTSQGLDWFRQAFVGPVYDQVPKHSRRFVERESNTTVEVRLSGHYPGITGPGPFAFPDPALVGEEIEGVVAVTLAELIQLKLAERRYYDSADVVSLIEVHNLDESFMEKPHPSVRDNYRKCLEEKRRQDEWEARNG